MGNTVRGIVSAYVDGEKLWETTNTITNDGKNWLAARLHDPNRNASFPEQGRQQALTQRAFEDLQYPGQLYHTTSYNSLRPEADPVADGGLGSSGYTRAYVALPTNPEGDSQVTGEIVQTNNISQQTVRSRSTLRLGTSNQATSVNDTDVISSIAATYWPNELAHNQSSYFTSGRFQSTVANTDNATNADMEFNFQPNRENHDTLGYAIGTTVDAAGTSIGPGNAGSKTISASATSITVATPHLFPVAVQADSSTHYFIEITDTSGGSNDGNKEIVKVTDTGTHTVSSRRPAIALTGHGLSYDPYVRPYFTRTSEFTIVRAQQSTSAMAFPTQFDTDSLTNRGHTFKTVMHRNVHYFATTGANNVLSKGLPLEGTPPNSDTEVYVREAGLIVKASAVQPNWEEAGFDSATSIDTWGARQEVLFSRVLFPNAIKLTKDSYLFELVWDIQFP